MKFQVSDGEKYQKIMEAEVPVAEMEAPIKYACKRLADKVSIPGFRKGKAPRAILENFLGIQAILDEAADDMIAKAYSQGLKETGLIPVSRPDAEVVTLTADAPCVFKYTITVRPEVKLGQYKELPVTRRIVEVNDEDVDRDLEQQRSRLSRLVTLEEGVVAEKGHILNIDFTGYKDGVPFPGGEGKGYPLELGSNSFIPGFEDQLIGCLAGEEKDIEVTFPEDYQAEELAGQPVTFHVKVNEIRTNQLPELDEAFAQQVSETAENIEQLREEIKERLTKDSLRMADDNTRNSVIMLAVEGMETDVPPVMIENQIDSILESQSQRLQAQGLSMEKFLEYTGSTLEQMRENFREQAEAMVKRDLLMEEVAKAEDIQVSPEEQEEQLQLLATNYMQPLEKIREVMSKNERMNDLIESVKMQKAEDLIFDTAVVTDEIVDREALMKEAAARAEADAKAEAAEAEAAVEEAPADAE